MRKKPKKMHSQSSIGNRRLLCPLTIVLLFWGVATADPYYSTPKRDEGKGRALYSLSFSIHGRPAEAGDEIGAFDSSGVCRGRFTVTIQGQYLFMPVHGKAGEAIHFRVVSTANKREYVVTGSYIVSGATAQFDSVEFELIAGEEYDSDGDGMCNYWEWFYSGTGLDPHSWNDPSGDADGDELSDIREYESGSDPLSADTDGDGFTDLAEVVAGSDPDDGQITPGALRVNFCPDLSAPSAGYMRDSSMPYSLKGYGWQ